jgi:hypothetical protein
MLVVRVQQRYSAVATRFIIPQSLDERRYLWQKLTLRRVAHFVSLYVKKSEFTKALEKAKKELSEFGTKIMGIGAGISAAGAAITGSLTGALLHFAKAGDELDKMSLRTGVSATALAELGFAAEQSGANMDTVESALKRMARNLGEIGPEGAKTTAALEAIGLSSDRLKRLSPEDQFQLIAERIGDIQDPTKRAAAAMAVFGEGGRQLLPMLENIRELRQEARDLGIAPSPESVAAAAQVTDAINRVRRVIGATIFEIGAAIAPMAQDVLAGFLQVVSAVRKFVVANKALVVTAAKVGAVLVVVGTAIMGIGAAFIGAGLAIGGLLSAMSAVAAVGSMISAVMGAVGAVLGALLTPVGLIGVALVAGAVAWARFTQSGQMAVSTLVGSVTSLFGKLRKTVGDTMGGIVTAIQAGDLALAGQIAMVGLRLVFMQGLEAITDLFGETIGGIIGKLANGDLLGAWNAVGSAMLNTWAQIAKSIVNIFTTAMRAIDEALEGRITKISQALAIIKDGEGGIIKAAFASLIPKKQKDDPFNAALDAIDQAAQFTTDATDSAVQDAVGGTAKGNSQAVADLKAELDALRKQAAEKLEAGRIGKPEEDEVDGPTGSESASRSMRGRGSMAATNLMSLQTAMNSPQDRQIKLAEDANKKADEQIGVLEQVVAGIQRLGWFHP